MAKWVRVLCCDMLSCGFESHQCLWICLQVCGSESSPALPEAGANKCHTRYIYIKLSDTDIKLHEEILNTKKKQINDC